MSFDKETFLNTEVRGKMETTYTPLPIDDYTGYIDDIDGREAGDSRILDVIWAITDEKAKEFLGMDKPTVRQSIFLDYEEDGTLQFGKNKNLQLGKVREAVGQNGDGAWTPRMLVGAGPCLLKIGHRADKNDPEKRYADVKQVVKA